MTLIYSVIMTAIFFLVLPSVIGSEVYATFFEMRPEYERNCFRISFSLVSGNLVFWAVFQILAVPLILLKCSLTLVMCLWCCIMTVLLVLIFLRRRKRAEKTPILPQIVLPENKKMILLLLLVAIPILYQCWLYAARLHLDEDDSRFIVHAVTAFETDRMLLDNPATGSENTLGWISEYNKDAASPWPIYLAMLSRILQIHPAIFAHTVYAPYLLLLSYAVFFLMGLVLFQGSRKYAAIFTGIASFARLFYAGSTRTEAEFALIRIWQGKAVVASISIPMIICLFLFLYREKYQKNDGQEKIPDTGLARRIELTCRRKAYISVSGLLLLLNFASCLLSGMGITITAILIGIYGFWYATAWRSPKAFFWFLPACSGSVLYGVIYVLLGSGIL